MKVAFGCLGLLSVVAAVGANSASDENRPHVSRGAEEPARLFESLSAKEIGVDFVYRWSPEERYEHEMVNAVTGGGVALGDWDGDRLADVFLTQPFAGNRLYRNLGGFRFEPSEAVQDDKWGTGASFVDLDNDGDLDLFVCGYDCANRLYLNDGDGSFREGAAIAGLDYAGASVMAAFADYDADGDLDLYLLTNHIAPSKSPVWQYEVRRSDGMPILPDHLKGVARVLYRPDLRQGKLIPAGERDLLFRNEGPGIDGWPRFTDVTDEAGLTGEYFGLGVVWFDFDRDQWPDIYVANDFWGPDQLFRNQGDGTFEDVTRQSLPHTPWFSMGVDTADINNDGWPDLLASDMSGATHYREKLSMGDMQSWFPETSQPPQFMRNALYLNSGTSRFLECAFLAGVASTDWTWSVRFEDFDGDGWQDLFVTNGAERYWDNSDLMSSSRGVQRIDTQELRDLWLPTPQRKDPNYVFRNDRELRFTEVGSEWGLDARQVSYGVGVADFDNDGDLDIVTNNFEDEPSFYRNASSAAIRSVTVSLRGTQSNRYGLGATLQLTADGERQYRYLTSARGFMSSAAPAIHFGLGKKNPQELSLTVDWPSGLRQVVTDVQPGRHLIVREPEQGDAPQAERLRPLFRLSRSLFQAGRLERPFDDFARQPLLPHKHSQLGPGMAWADVDGDGHEDFYLGRSAGHGGTIFLSREPAGETGEPRFLIDSLKPFDRDASKEDLAPLFLDADGDGDRDLLVVSGSVEAEAGSELYHDRLYLNDGRGAFTPAPEGTLPDDRFSSGPACAADFDKDGDLDVFIGSRIVPGRYPTAPTSRLLRNESGRFRNCTEEVAPGLAQAGMISAAIWSDVNLDGWPDLWVVGEWMSPRLFLNRRGVLSEASAAAGLAGLTGWWNGIEGADLDRDGDLDYVLTNFGRNIKYRASEKKPVLLYYGDLDGSGVKRIVEAKMVQELMLPIRGKSCSQLAMPGLGDRFPTFHSFALATLPDLYGEDRLSDALRLTATTLDNGVLWNESDREANQVRFRFSPLPRLAQIAPAFAPVISDFDANGWPDIFLSQNFFSPQSETGRMDGGVGILLSGIGNRKFRPLYPRDSGIVAYFDGRSAAVVDVDRNGAPDIVLASNSAPVLTYLNRVASAKKHLAISLQGRNGNPDAVGAIIRIEEGGYTAVHEIRAGSGYLSQSVPTVFLGLTSPFSPLRVRVRWPDGLETQRELENPRLGKMEFVWPAN